MIPNVIYVCKSFALRWGAPKGTRHWIENFFSFFPTHQILSEGGLCFQSRFYHHSVFSIHYYIPTSKFKYYARKILFLVHFCTNTLDFANHMWARFSYCSIPNLPKRSKNKFSMKIFPMMLSKNQKSCWKCT